jgi:hypothetical protein
VGATTQINEWNFQEDHVQAELAGGNFISAHTILFAAGPPEIRFAGNASTDFNNQDIAERSELNAVARPIGLLENVGISQNKQLQRLFEIGSKRSYFIPGRMVGSVNFARVLYHGPSLLRTLYAWYPAAKIGPSVANLLAAGAGRAGVAAPEIDFNPGFGDFFFNLDSDLFDQPFGYLMLVADADANLYGGIYFEMCYIQALQLSVNSTSIITAEGATAQFDKLVPVDVGAVSRVTEFAKTLEQQDAGA